MKTSAYFFSYLKRVLWLVVLMTGFLVALLNRQYFEDVETRQVRAVDAAISSEVQIELLIDNLKRSSIIFTQQYASLIQAAYTDSKSVEKLNRLISQHFNSVLIMMVTNEKGQVQLGGVNEQPSELCQKDIQRFLIGLDQEANVHKGPQAPHFDVINAWKANGQSGAFNLAFDIKIIEEILEFHQPNEHRLLLVDKFHPSHIEVRAFNDGHSNKDTSIDEDTLKNAIFNTEVNGTRWSLIVLKNESAYTLYQYQNVLQIVVIVSLFLVVIIVGLLRLSKETVVTQNLLKREQKQKQKYEDMLHSLVEGTSGATGSAFFYSLVKELSNYMQVDYAFIAIKQKSTENSYLALANWAKEYYKTKENIIIPKNVFENNSFRYIEQGFEKQFDCELANDLFPVSGFLGARLFNNKGEEIAVLVVMSPHKLLLKPREIAVMKVFASRAEAEIDRNNAEEELRSEKERAQISLHSIGDGVITTNEKAEVDFMNPAAEKLTGWSEELAKGLVLSSVFHLEDETTGDVIPDPAQHCIEEKRMVSPKTDNVLISKNTDRFSIQGTASPMFGLEGDCIGAVVVFNDVTAAREMERKIAFQASHDALTGLVNRTEFERRLESLFNSAKEFEHNHVLLYLDLDQFKVVNDTAGHLAGDELLIQVAHLLLEQLRGRDTLGRLGGDEFSVLLEHCPISEAKMRAQSLIDAIREYSFIWEKKSYQIGVSIGLVPITQHSLSTVQIMTQADLACYTAKDKGRGQAHLFEEDDAEVASRHRELLRAADLKNAIDEHRFELLYQPIIALNNDDAKMHGEVLLRLLDDNGEHILPGAFIPAAERYGIMDKIDHWVLTKIFKDYNHIFEQNPDLLLSINLSGNSFKDDELLPFVLNLFAHSNILPQQICFEITETAAISSYKQLNRFIKVVKERGCRFALDDFGSGLSSFSYLKTMKVDYLKIDGHFVKDLCQDDVDMAMVKSMNEMGHILGLKTIAECADDEEIVVALKALGVDFAQGYYLGNLVPMDSMALGHDAETEGEQPRIN